MATIGLESVDEQLDNKTRRDLQMGLAAANKEDYFDAANGCILYGLVKRRISETLSSF